MLRNLPSFGHCTAPPYCMEVEAEDDGARFTALLQNAETVRLMSATYYDPSDAPASNLSRDDDHFDDENYDDDEGEDEAGEGGDIAVSVSVLQPGDRVLVHRQTGARHTGLKIAEERWYEK